MFYVTNGEPGLVHLARLEAQVASSNGWKTMYTETAGILNPGAPTYEWAGGLLAGSRRAFYVHAPPEGRWRVRLMYFRTERGLFSFWVRARLLVRQTTATFAWPSFIQWSQGNVVRLRDQYEAVSQEFSQ